MSNYSIKSLEQLSGIKAHTIRIWEQRYNFLKPGRTDTNIRFYDDDDLKRILNIALLNKHGIKISKIALMSEDAILQEVTKLSEKDQAYSEQFKQLVISMIGYDEDQFEKAINTIILKIGFEKAMINVIYPFLNKVGILWQTNGICPAQEHFISNLIRQKLIVAIDALYTKTLNAKYKFLLFLPEGELHELALLFASFLIKNRGIKVIYLGQSLPLEDLKKAAEVHKPDCLFSMITSNPSDDDLDLFLKSLASSFSIPIFLSGYKFTDTAVKIPPSMSILKDVDEFIEVLEKRFV